MSCHFRTRLHRYFLYSAFRILSGLATIALLPGSAIALDTSTFPPFELEKEPREFNWLSIHPDSERWLISECTDRVTPPRNKCSLYLYDLKSGKYRSYELPQGYMYRKAEFSPSGQYIVGVRTPSFEKVNLEEFKQYMSSSEIFRMRIDGSDFQILPVPKGLLSNPRMSPDETKVAYFRADRIAQTARQTLMVDFELHELDLTSGQIQLFSGPLRISLAGGFQYKDKNNIVAQIYGSFGSNNSISSSRVRSNFSEIYCLKRGQKSISYPCLTDVTFASMPSLDSHGSLYVRGDDDKLGISIFEVNEADKRLQAWQVPKIIEGRLDQIVAAPDGSYVAFIYPTSDSKPKKCGIGIFDLQRKTWLSSNLPIP